MGWGRAGERIKKLKCPYRTLFLVLRRRLDVYRTFQTSPNELTLVQKLTKVIYYSTKVWAYDRHKLASSLADHFILKQTRDGRSITGPQSAVTFYLGLDFTSPYS